MSGPYVRRMGRERSRVLAVRSVDPVMSVLGPVGLAASSGTALVVDFNDQMGRSSSRSLADLVTEGPRLAELSPGRKGVAILRAGGVGVAEAHPIVERLAVHWPAVVVREPVDGWPGPVVPVQLMYPGCLYPTSTEPSVWQSLGLGARPPGPGPILPPLNPAQVRRVLNGSLPTRGRWLTTWERVWELPWA